MYICLFGRHYAVNHFCLQVFLSEQDSNMSRCIFFIFTLQAQVSSDCWYLLELHSERLSLSVSRLVLFCCFATFGSWFFLTFIMLSSVDFKHLVARGVQFMILFMVNCGFKFLGAQNLTCLNPMLCILITNFNTIL